jgi:hypothetical protein
VLGLSSAAAVLIVYVVFSLNGTISRIYLLDALAEFVLALAWVIVALMRRGESKKSLNERARAASFVSISMNRSNGSPVYFIKYLSVICYVSKKSLL